MARCLYEGLFYHHRQTERLIRDLTGDGICVEIIVAPDPRRRNAKPRKLGWEARLSFEGFGSVKRVGGGLWECLSRAVNRWNLAIETEKGEDNA